MRTRSSRPPFCARHADEYVPPATLGLAPPRDAPLSPRMLLRADLGRPCMELAKMLLGKVLCRRTGERVLRGMIVGTEAYLGPHDMASHSYGGRRTARNEAMYMRAGTCYVYLIYGMHHCLNISSVEEGAAVLVRALEPLNGAEWMQVGRGRRMREIANGPSKLCAAMGITRAEIDKEDIITSDKIWLEDGREVEMSEIETGKRVGLGKAGVWREAQLRFYIAGSEFVSRREARHAQSRI
uniref:DNA-3-methyladenine glycosylase n=1 Tax=Homalodisca liturata TaxID=320908 RepID=A0A1B6HVL7_9HEMI